MNDDKPFYEHHVFFCMNVREGEGLPPELRQGRRRSRAEARQEAHQGTGPERPGQGAHQPGRLPGALRGRPGRGHLPAGHLVHLCGHADIDDIIDRHLVGGEVVERLKI
jgi:hypothetical protein